MTHDEFVYNLNTANELYHHGVKGQRWGVRRYMNGDGSLTPAGKLRYKLDNNGKVTKYSKEEKRTNIENKRTKIISELSKKDAKEYNNSKEGRAFNKWQKNNPNSPSDDFGDYLAAHPEIKAYTKYSNAGSDAKKLYKNYATTQAVGGALVSAFYLAPIAGLVTKKVTGSGKKALLASLGTVSAMATVGYVKGKTENIKTEKKYGLR